MNEVDNYVIKAWYDKGKGLFIELYYKVLNTVRASDIAPGQALKIDGKTYPIVDWELSKDTGNPVFHVKGFEPAVRLINNKIINNENKNN